MPENTLTHADAVAIAKRVSKAYGVPFSGEKWQTGEITVVEGSHEEADCDWILSWEEGPDGWAYGKILQDATAAVLPFWFAEPIAGHAVGFYE